MFPVGQTVKDFPTQSSDFVPEHNRLLQVCKKKKRSLLECFTLTEKCRCLTEAVLLPPIKWSPICDPKLKVPTWFDELRHSGGLTAIWYGDVLREMPNHVYVIT